jgi:hypothetical protein
LSLIFDHKIYGWFLAIADPQFNTSFAIDCSLSIGALYYFTKLTNISLTLKHPSAILLRNRSSETIPIAKKKSSKS